MTSRTKSEAVSFDYGSVLTDLDKEFRLVSGYSADTVRVHTGSYVVDLLIGGGYYPGRWYTVQGFEASGKTTMIMEGADAALHTSVPILEWWDYEGAMDLNYFQTLMTAKLSVEDLFGLRDSNGKVIKRGRIGYHNPDVAETFFDVTSAMLRRLPDKRYIKERDQWFYVFEDNTANKKFKANMDSKLSGSGLIYVPAPNGDPQGMLFLDSYPAMLPERQDVDDPGAGLAAKARMFSENLDRVRPKLRRKAVTVIGVNQIRLKPGPSFGCLHADTKISFVDGRSFTMRRLVEDQIQGEVWSFNEDTHRIEPRKITGWHYNGEVSRPNDWITIRIGTPDTPNGFSSVTVTPNHLVYTKRGWVKAKDITEADRVLSKFESRFCPVLLIQRDSVRKFRNRGKYDITVEGNSNYLAGSPHGTGVLVHNSPMYSPCGETLKFACISGNSYIFTDQGILRASDCTTSHFSVLGRRGLENTNPFFPVGKRSTSELTLSNGISLVGASNHRILCIRQGSNTFRWKKLCDLSKEHYVAVKVGSNIWSSTNFEIPDIQFKTGQGNHVEIKCIVPRTMTESLAKLMGYLVSDGFFDGKRFNFVNKDILVIGNFVSLIKDVFGLDATVSPMKNGCYQVQMYNYMVGSVLSMCGLKGLSNEKCIPFSVLLSTKEVILSFLAGYADGDSSLTTTKKEMILSSVSKKLVDDIQQVLLNLGIPVKQVRKQIVGFNPGKSGKKFIHELSLYGTNFDRFFNMVPTLRSVPVRTPSIPIRTFPSDIINKSRTWCKRIYAKMQRVKRISNQGYDFSDLLSQHRLWKKNCSVLDVPYLLSLDKLGKILQTMRRDGIYLFKISNIEHNLPMEMMYDCTMPETHSVVTNGIISHNSDVRLNMRAVSIPKHGTGTGKVAEEKSVLAHGNDHYRYIKIDVEKNKVGPNFRSGYLRVWMDDPKSKGHGFCPVYDVYEYLRLTGQVSGKMGKMVLSLPERDSLHLSWNDLKSLVLLKGEPLKDVHRKLKIDKRLDFKSMILGQIRSGKASELYNANRDNTASEPSEE